MGKGGGRAPARRRRPRFLANQSSQLSPLLIIKQWGAVKVCRLLIGTLNNCTPINKVVASFFLSRQKGRRTALTHIHVHRSPLLISSLYTSNADFQPILSHLQRQQFSQHFTFTMQSFFSFFFSFCWKRIRHLQATCVCVPERCACLSVCVCWVVASTVFSSLCLDLDTLYQTSSYLQLLNFFSTFLCLSAADLHFFVSGKIETFANRVTVATYSKNRASHIIVLNLDN